MKTKEISKRVLDAISKVEIYECDICGSYIGEEENKKGEGVCYKHWDY